MSVVYTQEWEGYTISLLPVEKYQVVVTAPDGGRLYEFDAETTEREAFARGQGVAEEHWDDFCNPTNPSFVPDREYDEALSESRHCQR